MAKKSIEEVVGKEVGIGVAMVAYVLSSDESISIGFCRNEDERFGVTITPVRRPNSTVMGNGETLAEAWQAALDEIENRKRSN